MTLQNNSVVDNETRVFSTGFFKRFFEQIVTSRSQNLHGSGVRRVGYAFRNFQV